MILQLIALFVFYPTSVIAVRFSHIFRLNIFRILRLSRSIIMSIFLSVLELSKSIILATFDNMKVYIVHSLTGIFVLIELKVDVYIRI